MPTTSVRIAVCAVASLLAARCAWFLGPGWAVLAAAMGVAYAAMMTSGTRAGTAHVAFALLLPLALALSGLPAVDLSSFDEAWVAQEPGQMPLLALRICALLLFVLVVPPRRRDAAIALGFVGSLLLLSLAVRGALLPYVLVTAVIARFAPVDHPGEPRAKASVSWLLVAFGLLGVLPLHAPRNQPIIPSDAPDLVAYWRGRDNLFEARWWARRWATTEPVPGHGYLALAEVDRQLGHVTQARRVLEKVLAHPATDEVRARAEQLIATLPQAPASPADP